MDTSKLLRISFAGALVAASLAVAAYAATPRGASPTAASDPGDTSSAVAARPASGPNEGIQVHGRWVIEVTNPDGSLADRREFENALVGGAHLSSLLARTASVGRWAVELKSSDTIIFPTGTTVEFQPCGKTTTTILITITTHHPCTITEAGSGIAAHQAVFETLTIAAPSAGANAGAFVLSGSATARADAQIKKVATMVAHCAAADAPATPCATAPGTAITSTTLATPVDVSNGQQIQVTVVISFQ